MKKKGYGKLALFLTAMLWGTTFAIGKIATETFSPSFIIALRFTVASIALIIAAVPLYGMLNKQYWIDGIWMLRINKNAVCHLVCNGMMVSYYYL